MPDFSQLACLICNVFILKALSKKREFFIYDISLIHEEFIFQQTGLNSFYQIKNDKCFKINTK